MSKEGGALREHEKFWAFVILVASVVGLAVLASQMSVPNDTSPLAVTAYTGKLRIIDAVAGGLLTIAGMCAQALFRINQSDRDLASAARTTADTAAKLADKAPSADPNSGTNSSTDIDTTTVNLGPGERAEVKATDEGNKT